MPDQEHRPPILELTGVTRSYTVGGGFFSGRARQVRALAGVDLSVGHGETVGLVGESGCGKSTLARLAVALERPDTGSVRLDGRDPWTAGAAERRNLPRLVQMVFQDPFSSLNPRLPIGWTVAEGLRAMMPPDPSPEGCAKNPPRTASPGGIFIAGSQPERRPLTQGAGGMIPPAGPGQRPGRRRHKP